MEGSPVTLGALGFISIRAYRPNRGNQHAIGLQSTAWRRNRAAQRISDKILALAARKFMTVKPSHGRAQSRGGNYG